ncbi:UNVERIFIED_CONTAM: hypothetical protein Sradi_5706200 [Sesamum radiatum]|uniref:HAT C-terminal dimerisation domain-containing protein n=1 Tax=Sesamum radiatum TaxID=300843 RepID=A0AAW2L2J6_SESRA
MMMVISEQWCCQRDDDITKARNVKEKLLDDSWWDSIDYILDFTKPIYEMLRATDTDKPCLHLIYDIWDNMISKVKKMIYKHEKKADYEESSFWGVVHKVLEDRWSKSNTPLHCLAHSLNPRWEMDPIKWWLGHGSTSPHLQSTSLKLLVHSSSSSCCERNWSTYPFIQSTRRNQITPQHAQDLIFVQNNFRLLSRTPQYIQGDTKMWDMAEDTFQTIEDVGILEIANLSLDEPELESVLFDEITKDPRVDHDNLTHLDD